MDSLHGLDLQELEARAVEAGTSTILHWLLPELWGELLAALRAGRACDGVGFMTSSHKTGHSLGLGVLTCNEVDLIVSNSHTEYYV